MAGHCMLPCRTGFVLSTIPLLGPNALWSLLLLCSAGLVLPRVLSLSDRSLNRYRALNTSGEHISLVASSSAYRDGVISRFLQNVREADFVHLCNLDCNILDIHRTYDHTFTPLEDI